MDMATLGTTKNKDDDGDDKDGDNTQNKMETIPNPPSFYQADVERW